jgi:predicted TIM-barrel fold metal-dependent hydrolase
MPYQDDMKIISVDDHLIEHPRVWLDRLPERYHAVAPHVINDGPRQYWVYENRVDVLAPGLAATAGRPREEWGYSLADGLSQSDMLPGCYDPKARLNDMDIDGVWAQVCFPSYPRFAGVRFLSGKDKDLALLCVQAYNDFIIDEWCATAPDRFIPLGILPLWDARLAAAEIERLAGRGGRSVTFPEHPEPLGLPSWHTGYWDPVFAAAAETNLPLATHIGTSQRPPPISSDALGKVDAGGSPAGLVLNSIPLMALVVDLTFSHVLTKFPNLKIALSEGGVGWIPYIKERMDQRWDKDKLWAGLDSDAKPSELFNQHFWGCCIEDEAGLRERDLIGVGNIMIESDYPHSDSTWPYTRKRVEELLADVPDDEARQIVEDNARELYNFPA